MAFTNPLTWVAQNLTAALLNQQLRDNMNETAPGIATAAGRLIVTDGANSIVERIPTLDAVATSETTASTSYTDLATAGPEVTVTTGTLVQVTVSAFLQNNTATAVSFMTFEVSGASTITADDARSLAFQSSASGGQGRFSRVFLATVTAGSNTFTAKYRVSAGTGTVAGRQIEGRPF